MLEEEDEVECSLELALLFTTLLVLMSSSKWTDLEGRVREDREEFPKIRFFLSRVAEEGRLVRVARNGVMSRPVIGKSTSVLSLVRQ